MASYPYAPPPPPPTSSATPAAQYPSYSQPHSYSAGSHRGSQPSYVGGGRGRGHHDYGSGSRYYSQQPDYAPSPPNGHYPTPQASAHWQSTPPVNHYPPHQQSAPHPAAPAYPTNYNSQGYNAPLGQGYQPQYPNASARPSHGPPYSAYPNDHPPQRWSEQGQAFPPYSNNRGGRGGFQSDRGGHKSENPMVPPTAMRLGFEHNNDRVVHTTSPYGSPYQPSPQSGPYTQPPYNYPPAPENPYSAPVHAPHNAHGYSNRGGPGRDGFSHSNRGGRGGHGNRGEKFRHREQRPAHGFNPSQKPDAAVHSKKKKRKTNTLGLTPGDESSEAEGALDDEEKRLSELLGGDAPVIPDMAAWIAERKANFPTKTRIEAKKAAEVAPAPKADDSSKPQSTKLEKDQAKIDRLEKKLSKLKGSIEKRKRAANDEGDEMRADESAGLSDSSDDEEPEVQPSSKPATTYLPPPPIARADPSNHCKYYSTGGTCGKKGKCRFKHDPAVREAALQERTRNGGRMTLKQRLLLNDKDHDDMDVVKAVVEMRSSGRLVDPQNLQVRSKHQVEEQVTASPAPSTLPTTAGVASLPPNPYAASKKTAAHKVPDQVQKPQQEVPYPYQNTHLPGYSGA
ncbi:putative nuclear fragile x mental retardation-interacting protein 1 protein [Rosellinia necatrix]|uniref:Putative nuclear fragile x mental retardation-interacting protein 1 protein n=1 Tax=Rosellinia necatrix TaxID=77044 RepID=A0A1S7UI68_ROSNE|nr:putative nuclear fragile x mental retardation-interacting protein 1 protein [Rosellinia necatrix]